LFFDGYFTHYHLAPVRCIGRGCLSFVSFRARARSKQARKETKERQPRHRYIDGVVVFLLFRLKSISIYFIRILFPSKPIHELRLDLNVTNTVIALTIRVI